VAIIGQNRLDPVSGGEHRATRGAVREADHRSTAAKRLKAGDDGIGGDRRVGARRWAEASGDGAVAITRPSRVMTRPPAGSPLDKRTDRLRDWLPVSQPRHVRPHCRDARGVDARAESAVGRPCRYNSGPVVSARPERRDAVLADPGKRR